MPPANAVLTSKGRFRLTRCIVEDRWLLARAAEQSFNLSLPYRAGAVAVDHWFSKTKDFKNSLNRESQARSLAELYTASCPGKLGRRRKRSSPARGSHK